MRGNFEKLNNLLKYPIDIACKNGRKSDAFYIVDVRNELPASHRPSGALTRRAVSPEETKSVPLVIALPRAEI